MRNITFPIAQVVGQGDGLPIFAKHIGVGTRRRMDRLNEEAEPE